MLSEYLRPSFPYVNTTECGAGTDEELKDLTSTQRALVRALRTSTDRDEIYKTLSANIRVKLRPYLYGNDTTLVYDRLCIPLDNRVVGQTWGCLLDFINDYTETPW